MTQDNQPVAQEATQPVAEPASPQSGESPAAPGQVPMTTPNVTLTKMPKLEKWTIIRTGIFAILAVWTLFNIILFWLNGVTPRGLVWAIWWPAAFMIQFAVFTTPWRAITVKEMARMFLIGLSVVFIGVLIGEYLVVGAITAFPDLNPLNWILTSLLGGYDPMSDVASPVVEELFKLLPVAIFMLLAGRGYWKRALGPLDVALLGGSVGAGYLFMENIARVTGSSMSTLGWDRSVVSASFGIDPFFLFPDMYHGSVSVWPGHATTAMFIGLFLGFGLLIRKKIPVVWMILPLGALTYTTWLHFLINYLKPGNQQFWAQIVLSLHLNGGLFQYILILGLLMAIAVATVTKYLFLRADRGATVAVVGKETLEYVKAHQKEPLLILQKLWSLRHFWSYRHAIGYGILYAQQQKPEEREMWISWLYDLRQMALGKAPG